MLGSVDNYPVEVLLSLALVAGGYALVNRLHMSGPIAMVVAGVLIGNLGRAYAMSPATLGHVDTFWELIDEMLNAVLIGLEVLALAFTGQYLLVGLLAVPVVLFARLCRWPARSRSCGAAGGSRGTRSGCWRGEGYGAASRWPSRCPCRARCGANR